jgi:hypothetical protein
MRSRGSISPKALTRGELDRVELIFRDVIKRYAYSSPARDAGIRLADIKVHGQGQLELAVINLEVAGHL